MKELFLCVVLAIIDHSQTATAKNPLETSLLVNKLKKQIWENKAMEYLKTYGYIQKDEDVNPDSVKAALKRMQTMAHVKVTGEMNKETSKSMNQKRCGVPDEFPGDKNHPDSKQKRRYVRAVWRKRHLTYKFTQMSRDMPPARIKSAIEAAFRSWSRYIPLTFTESIDNCDPVDIEIAFVSGKHSSSKFNYCRKMFDGPGKVLARGYFPCYYRTTQRNLCGDIHIDDGDLWTIGYQHHGQPLQRTIAHEIGHSLGLHHSKTPSTLMYSAEMRHTPKEPTREDIARIKRLYPSSERLSSHKSRCHPDH